MKNDSDSRRAFLQKVGAVAASLTIVPIAAGCGGGDNGGASGQGEAAGGAVANVDCSDLSSLTENDMQLRENLKYVVETADPAKRCDNCQFYVTTDETCGTCTILKGPIEPAGYCMTWAAKPA